VKNSLRRKWKLPILTPCGGDKITSSPSRWRSTSMDRKWLLKSFDENIDTAYIKYKISKGFHPLIERWYSKSQYCILRWILYDRASFFLYDRVGFGRQYFVSGHHGHQQQSEQLFCPCQVLVKFFNWNKMIFAEKPTFFFRTSNGYYRFINNRWFVLLIYIKRCTAIYISIWLVILFLFSW